MNPTPKPVMGQLNLFGIRSKANHGITHWGINSDKGRVCDVPRNAPNHDSATQEQYAAELVRRWNCHSELVEAISIVLESSKVEGPEAIAHCIDLLEKTLAHATP